MDETKVALIPNIVLQGAMGPKQYGLLLTDRRSIFVLESAAKVGLGAVLGGVVGAAIAQAAATRERVDYERASLPVLVSNPKNVIVPHDSIQSLGLRWKLGSYRLRIEYVREDGKEKKLEALVVPPAEQIRENKARGLPAKMGLMAYAERVKLAYQRALPSAVGAKAEWGV